MDRYLDIYNQYIGTNGQVSKHNGQITGNSRSTSINSINSSAINHRFSNNQTAYPIHAQIGESASVGVSKDKKQVTRNAGKIVKNYASLNATQVNNSAMIQKVNKGIQNNSYIGDYKHKLKTQGVLLNITNKQCKSMSTSLINSFDITPQKHSYYPQELQVQRIKKYTKYRLKSQAFIEKYEHKLAHYERNKRIVLKDIGRINTQQFVQKLENKYEQVRKSNTPKYNQTYAYTPSQFSRQASSSPNDSFVRTKTRQRDLRIIDKDTRKEEGKENFLIFKLKNSLKSSMYKSPVAHQEKQDRFSVQNQCELQNQGAEQGIGQVQKIGGYSSKLVNSLMKYTKNNAMSKKYRHIVDKMNVKYDSTSHSKQDYRTCKQTMKQSTSIYPYKQYKMERSFVAFTPKSRGAKDLDREKSKEKELIKQRDGQLEQVIRQIQKQIRLQTQLRKLKSQINQSNKKQIFQFLYKNYSTYDYDIQKLTKLKYQQYQFQTLATQEQQKQNVKNNKQVHKDDTNKGATKSMMNRYKQSKDLSCISVEILAQKLIETYHLCQNNWKQNMYKKFRQSTIRQIYDTLNFDSKISMDLKSFTRQFNLHFGRKYQPRQLLRIYERINPFSRGNFIYVFSHSN